VWVLTWGSSAWMFFPVGSTLGLRMGSPRARAPQSAPPGHSSGRPARCPPPPDHHSTTGEGQGAKGLPSRLGQEVMSPDSVEGRVGP